MSLGWLRRVAQIAPMILSVIPATAPIASLVAAGIASASQIKGATGEQKKQHALEIVAAGVEAANVKAGKIIIDPASAITAAATGIETVISTAKIVDAAHDALHPVDAGDGAAVPPVPHG